MNGNEDYRELLLHLAYEPFSLEAERHSKILRPSGTRNDSKHVQYYRRALRGSRSELERLLHDYITAYSGDSYHAKLLIEQMDRARRVSCLLYWGVTKRSVVERQDEDQSSSGSRLLNILTCLQHRKYNLEVELYELKPLSKVVSVSVEPANLLLIALEVLNIVITKGLALN